MLSDNFNPSVDVFLFTLLCSLDHDHSRWRVINGLNAVHECAMLVYFLALCSFYYFSTIFMKEKAAVASHLLFIKAQPVAVPENAMQVCELDCDLGSMKAIMPSRLHCQAQCSRLREPLMIAACLSKLNSLYGCNNRCSYANMYITAPRTHV